MSYEAGEILKEWLEDEGYGGLYNLVGECGCEIGDIAPCNHMNLTECKAGHKKIVKDGWEIIP